jgi:hypothetical protein
MSLFTVHLYLTQSFQKLEAENFLRNTVVQPPKILIEKQTKSCFEIQLLSKCTCK